MTVASTAGAHVVASVAGALRAAAPAEAEEGIAFWVETAGGDRLGYGLLAAYASGIAEGAAVAAGQPLGTSGRVRAHRLGQQGGRLDPFPLLEATRPPSR